MPTPDSFLPQSEAQLQAACHVWFHNELCARPEYAHLRGLGFMIHNDGVKSWAAAAQDKARGTVAGIPDWQLAVPRPSRLGIRTYHGLFVEFKTATGSLDAKQRRRIEQLQAQGYRVEVVRSEAAFRALLTEYLAPA